MMGTKRRVCLWYRRGKREFVAWPAGWKPKDGDIVFSHKEQLIAFAMSAGMVLKELPRK